MAKKTTETREPPQARPLFLQRLETISARMAVVEMRRKTSPTWEILRVVSDPAQLGEHLLEEECRDLASMFGLGWEFRWRYGELRLEDSRHCTVYTKTK